MFPELSGEKQAHQGRYWGAKRFTHHPIADHASQWMFGVLGGPPKRTLHLLKCRKREYYGKSGDFEHMA